MRAFEIALMCVLLQASIVFVGNLNVFPADPIGSAAGRSEYTEWTVESTLGEIRGNETLDMNIFDEIALGVKWLISSFMWFMKLIFGIVFIYVPLTRTFGVPAPLSALIQTGVVFIYIYGWLSWKSNRSSKYME